MMISSRRLGRACSGSIALLAMFIVVSASGQDAYTDTPGVPETPGADRVPEVLAAYNSGTAAAIESAVRMHFVGPFVDIPMAQHVAVWRDSRRRTGPLELLAFRSYDPPHPELVPILRSTATGAFHAFVLPVEDDDPHRFTGMQISPARTPSFLEAGRPREGAELAAAVDALIDRLVAHDMFSGTVVIAKDGATVYERAAGLASRRFDVPNRLDTKFNLGSMNKMFTAVAVAQLVDAGRLAYADTVGVHLPDYPNAAVRDTVQIRHLLSHTSGMGNHFKPEFIEASKMSYRDLDDYFELFADDPLAFAPGTDWSYSNAGFYVLGAIIQAVGGSSYYDYVRTRVYTPAGMSNTDAYDMDVPIKNLAIGYTTEDMGLDPTDDAVRWLEGPGWRNNMFMHSIKGGPAGGGFSTSPDLIAFARALRGGAILGSDAFATISSAKPEIASPQYGYGFGVEDRPGLGRIVGHSGGFPGINANLDLYLDAGYDVAVMANMDGAASTVARRIQDFIAGTP